MRGVSHNDAIIERRASAASMPVSDINAKGDTLEVLSVKNLVKSYGSTMALDHLNMNIEQGEVFGLLGPNGSGKTTAINCILQLLTYDKGQIELFGEPMSPTRYDLKRRIGIVPQNVAVFEELTVRENIDYFCGLYVRDAKERRTCVDDAIEFVGLQDYAKFRPRKLSGGLLRRLNIACGIAHKPELAFFDEPTVAVDPQSRASILQGILDMNAAGTTVVYTSHYMEEVKEICSRIMIMDKGRTLAIGTNAQLKVMTGIGENVEMEIAGLPEAARAKVQGLACVQRADYDGKALRVACSNGQHNVADILECLTAFEVHPGRIWSEPPTLNDVFLEITGRDLRD